MVASAGLREVASALNPSPNSCEPAESFASFACYEAVAGQHLDTHALLSAAASGEVAAALQAPWLWARDRRNPTRLYLSGWSR